MNRWICEVKKDPESLDSYIEFPLDLLSSIGWKPGDIIEWTPQKNGSWKLRKKENED